MHQSLFPFLVLSKQKLLKYFPFEFFYCFKEITTGSSDYVYLDAVLIFQVILPESSFICLSVKYSESNLPSFTTGASDTKVDCLPGIYFFSVIYKMLLLKDRALGILFRMVLLG